uniref:Uncharacterized protein n=1 Tax=Setaria digitata TaxID=48799 RepID=A0A915PMS9_9BILA
MVENNASTNSPAMIRFCLIPARQTGIASLCMQLVGLVMSAVLTLHLLIHLNGITITRNIKQQSKLPASANNVTLFNITTTQIPWTTLAITSAIVVGFSLTSIICGFALAFNTIWYKYVAYVNDNDQCLCIPLTAHLFKRHGQRRPIQGYSIPEVTRHPNLPYDNELVVNNFSRL